MSLNCGAFDSLPKVTGVILDLKRGFKLLVIIVRPLSVFFDSMFISSGISLWPAAMSELSC